MKCTFNVISAIFLFVFLIGFFSDLRRQVNVTIKRTDLTRLENFFIYELEPLEMSDILFEESVLTVTEHDVIEEQQSLKKRNEILLRCLKEQPEDQLYLFVYALMEGKKDFILEEIQKQPTEHSDQISGIFILFMSSAR